MKATDQLRAEHQGILQMLRVLGVITGKAASGATVEYLHLHRILEFLEVFVDKCHHGKEEEFLFPTLERAGILRDGGPIGVMLKEHDLGRNLVSEMRTGVEQLEKRSPDAGAHLDDSAGSYSDLLRNHISKEENVIFGVADKILSIQQQDSLYEDFERLETERIGLGTHEAFHRMMDELSGIYL